MLSNELRSLAAPQARVMMIIWGAFMAASVVYAVVGAVLMDLEPAHGGPDATMMQIIFAAVAISVAVSSFIVERILLAPARVARQLQQRPSVACLSGRNTSEISAIADRFGRLAESEQRLLCLVPFYQTSMIVVWAMREAVAIIGLVLTIMLGRLLVCVPFIAVAVALLAFSPPRVATFLEAGRRQLGGGV